MFIKFILSSVSTRLLASVWWFFTLIIVSSYTANLAAFLTVEQNQEIFRDVNELANQREDAPVFVKYGAKAGGATEGFFKVSMLNTLIVVYLDQEWYSY